jgi:deoxyuridine 5'-triphosphate nucleotidohydrolase
MEISTTTVHRRASGAHDRRGPVTDDPRLRKHLVTCEVRVSEKCRGTHAISHHAEFKNRKRNQGRYLCLACSRRLKHSGRKNPNATYALDDDFLQTIDTEGKAYLLGWIASDGSIQPGTINIVVHNRDGDVLSQIREVVCDELPIYRKNKTQVGLSISSRAVVEDVCRHLGVRPGRKSRCVRFPQLGDDELKWAFLRGFFDGDGSVSTPRSRRAPRISITTGSPAMRQAIMDFCGIRCYHHQAECKLEWYGNNALDFLGKLYERASYRLVRKYDLYLDWCTWVPSLSSGSRRYGRELRFRWTKTCEQAVAPFKERVSDSGYDLTLIDVARRFGNVTLYTTGIRIQPEFGWYFDLVPRSSLTKTGYAVANSVGVIDRTYTGPIMVPLVKLDPRAPDLELPARVVQIIPRPVVHVQIEEVEELDETARGAGGFGSTGR